MSKTFTLKKVEAAAVCGAGHGIGLELTKTILEQQPNAQLFASYRNKDQAAGLLELQKAYGNRLKITCLKPTELGSLENFYNEISSRVKHLDLIINSIGVLHDEGCRPEKSLEQISLDRLIHSFTVNAAITPLLAKALLPLIRKSHFSLFASISAKVGSIEDNRLGGWYGYRASKSALNMFIKNIAIECQNRSIPCIALAIHPGTTKTSLSEPYIKNTKLKIHSPEETASNILSVLEGKTLHQSGKFYSWDHKEIPW